MSNEEAPYPDIMFDIEALDTAETAVVLSVGWAYFDWNSPETPVAMGGHFCLDRHAQLADGRTISADTALWWAKQSTEAILSAFAGAESNEAGRYSKFIQGLENAERIWAHGIDYDCRIMANFLKKTEPDFRWPYWKQCDARTIKSLFADYVPEQPKLGTAHNALDDATNQAVLMRKIGVAIKQRDIRFQGLNDLE